MTGPRARARATAGDGWRRLATAGVCTARTGGPVPVPGTGTGPPGLQWSSVASARTDYWPSVGVAVGVEVGSVTVSVGSGVGLGARVWYSSCELVSTGTFAEVPSASG